jgi:hypothetical protein
VDVGRESEFSHKISILVLGKKYEGVRDLTRAPTPNLMVVERLAQTRTVRFACEHQIAFRGGELSPLPIEGLLMILKSLRVSD